MNNKELLAQHGLKYNPFRPAIPADDLWVPPAFDTFFYRLESQVIDGGFVLISSEPGLGKSKIMQLLAHRLARLDSVIVGVMERPQSNLSDFYRELGAVFGVNLSPSNRYGGFTALRERWQQHIKSTLFRPILLIDECQETPAFCLNELRILMSARFDSEAILTTVLCGDTRLPERFRDRSLLSLGTRIRLRLSLTPYTTAELMHFLEHLLDKAGAPHLMTPLLKDTLVAHAGGNLRLLTTMAAELLEMAALKKCPQLDEQLFLQVYGRLSRANSPKRPAKHQQIPA